MIDAPKFFSVTPPGAILDDTAATTAVIDCQGYALIVITAYFGATDIAAAVLKVQESDASGSGFTDISGSDLASSATATIDNTAIRWFIRPKKRYLDLNFTAGNGAAGTYFCAWADGYKAEALPTTATQLGLTAVANL